MAKITIALEACIDLNRKLYLQNAVCVKISNFALTGESQFYNTKFYYNLSTLYKNSLHIKQAAMASPIYKY